MKENYWVHESTYIEEGCSIGKDTRIWHFSHIMSNSQIGEACIIGQNVFIASGVVLGNGVKVQNNVSVYSGVECENDVFLGPSCVFTNVINPRSFIEKKNEFKKTLIKEGASIGANATIVCGTVIGRYALIGAGSVVTRDVPDYALIVGNPGRLKGYVCQCGEKLNLEQRDIVYCKSCGKKYRVLENIIENIENDFTKG